MYKELVERWYFLGCFSICAQISNLKDEENLMISSAGSRGLRRFMPFMAGRLDMAITVSKKRRKRG